ncbi:hypothetical protein P171DRAFT_426238 [Karstenula rhodostoma CBS 690.94]|uniref:RNA ligase domain-containing protein n=1 Tax=Karstenula rhodostoma CBS 690.94 TaxID=1392251 RepID=A0A9P4PZK5_9PLEO|nr:hypothetical protein P171DRAFT_426238 [Karstenula rhodostoma CBS 690.94]
MASASDSTLYPKITTHVNEVIKTLKYKLRDPDRPEEEPVVAPVPIIGTVKLHGTHADILVSSNDNINLQSRNNALLLETADNLGFAKAMSSKRPTILRLRDQFLVRWKELNREKALDTALPITIAGEWVGEKIQKGVAISKLSRRLVIISAKINGNWVADTDYADIEAPEDGIFNVSRAGTYRSVLYPEEPQKTIDELEPLADAIAAQCPFAATFGLTGEGEGLVWKLVPYISDSDLWFKTKGGRFKPTFTPAPKKPPVDQAERREAAKGLAQAWCSEQRLQQGWDYLREKGIEQDMKGIGAFLKWLQLDILSEEKGYITEYKIDEEMLKKEIIGRGKPWYLDRCTMIASPRSRYEGGAGS